MRKYPVVSTITRQAVNDYVVPDNPKYAIEKGTVIFIPVIGLHHDAQLYPNPEIFDPERFSPDMVKQRDPIEWLAFGEGPRNCIGMRFGKMQSRLGLASAIRNFSFTVSPKTDIPLKIDPVSMGWSPKNNIYLNVEVIKHI